jgi:hypothetical protein
MGRINALTEVDGISLKRGKEALEALDKLTWRFVENGYVKSADIELLRGIQYNLEAMVGLTEKCIKKLTNGHKGDE